MRPDIIAITETWLDSSISDTVCNLPSYSVIRKDRQIGIGGGVMFYINNNLRHRSLDHLLDSTIF
jgi:hypothetical protein